MSEPHVTGTLVPFNYARPSAVALVRRKHAHLEQSMGLEVGA